MGRKENHAIGLGKLKNGARRIVERKLCMPIVLSLVDYAAWMMLHTLLKSIMETQSVAIGLQCSQILELILIVIHYQVVK